MNVLNVWAPHLKAKGVLLVLEMKLEKGSMRTSQKKNSFDIVKCWRNVIISESSCIIMFSSVYPLNSKGKGLYSLLLLEQFTRALPNIFKFKKEEENKLSQNAQKDLILNVLLYN